MPATPPIIYTPPSAGSPPSAAGAVYEPAPAGKACLVLSGILTGGNNGTVRYCGLINGKPAWSTDGTQVLSATNMIVSYQSGTSWRVQLNTGAAYIATKVSAAAAPDGLTAWTVTPGTGSPVATAFAVGSPPVITS
jgi:hypothetical protein